MIWIDITLRILGSLCSLAVAGGLITSWVDMYRQGFHSRLSEASFWLNAVGVLGIAFFILGVVNYAIWHNLYL